MESSKSVFYRVVFVSILSWLCGCALFFDTSVQGGHAVDDVAAVEPDAGNQGDAAVDEDLDSVTDVSDTDIIDAADLNDAEDLVEADETLEDAALETDLFDVEDATLTDTIDGTHDLDVDARSHDLSDLEIGVVADVQGSDISESDCRSAFDCPADQDCNDEGFCVPNEESDAGPGPDAAGTCQTREATCDVATDCCSTLCVPVGVASEIGVCTEFCSDYRSCNPAGSLRDYFCARAGAPDVGTVNVCVVSDWERSCAASSDCQGQACLRSRSDSTCSWECSRSADCPPGSICGPVETSGGTLNLCTPIGESCAGPPTDCMSGTCLTDDVTGAGYCTQFCDPGTGKTCPSGWLCTAPDPTLPFLTVCTLP